MPIINFDYPDPTGRGYIKEAVNTDFIQRAAYNPYSSNYDSKPTIHLSFEGEVKKLYVGQAATDIYQYLQAQPGFIETEVKMSQSSTILFNMRYALRIFYRDKSQSSDNESVLTVEYGFRKEITEREPFDPSTHKPQNEAYTSGSSITILGDKADDVWNRFLGTAM
jgi:hypothetical protein